MAWRIIAMVAIVLAFSACVSSPPGDAGAGGSWTYAKGPHGENCLFYQSGLGDGHIVTMSCDSVKP